MTLHQKSKPIFRMSQSDIITTAMSTGKPARVAISKGIFNEVSALIFGDLLHFRHASVTFVRGIFFGINFNVI